MKTLNKQTALKKLNILDNRNITSARAMFLATWLPFRLRFETVKLKI